VGAVKDGAMKISDAPERDHHEIKMRIKVPAARAKQEKFASFPSGLADKHHRIRPTI
jgi:hypothetical protein